MNIKSITNTASVTGTTKAQVKNDSKTSFQSFLGESKDLDAIFQKAADKYGVDVKLLKAIGKAESNFDKNATSHCGAMGIMQLMPSTAKGLGVKNAYDPEENIMGGAKLISNLLKKYDGDVKLALAGYNAGTGNVRKYGGVPPFKETQNYIKKVLKYSGSTEKVEVQDTTSSSKTGTAQTTQATQTQQSSGAPAAGTLMIPSGYQIKRAAEQKANEEAASTTVSKEAVEQLKSEIENTDAKTIMNTLATSSRDQLTAYLKTLEENGQVKDVNDMFSYDDYVQFMNIFFKAEEEEDAATYGQKKDDAAIAQLQMTSSISSMLRNL